MLGTLLLAVASSVSATALPGQGHSEKLSKEAFEEGKARDKAKIEVLVRFRRNPGASERTLVRALGGEVRRHHRSRWMAVRVPGRAVEKMANHPDVEFVAMNHPISASMDVSRAAAGLPAPELPESVLKGSGVTIAMLDSGVAAHPEIQTLVAAVDLVGTYDPTFAPAGSVDTYGHGTHVAGIMVSNGSRSSGRFAGIAPEAGLVSVRVLDDVGRGRSSDALAGLEWVLAHKDQYGIRVLNLSLGHPVFEAPELDPLVQAVDALWDAGVVVVCSAGNDGRSGHGTITSPCNSRKVVTVGALNDHGTLDTTYHTVTTYSSRGPSRVNLVAKPDLIAPGNRIVSTLAAGSYLDVTYPERRVAADPAQPDVMEHFELSGTSMAAPMVSGAAALMLQQEPALNPGTVKARLMLSARKAEVGDPFATGAGALDILAALHATGQVVDAPSPLTFADSATGLMSFENTGALWSNPSFSLTALWSSAVVWSADMPLDAAMLTSSGALLPDTNANALLWPASTVAAEATLWPVSTLWSEAVLWPDGPSVDDLLGSLATLVSDP
jgi:serine protease AprX